MRARAFPLLAVVSLLLAGSAGAQGTSRGPWSRMGSFELAVGLGSGVSASSRDVRDAIIRAGFSTRERTSSIGPSASLTFRARTRPRVSLGVEMSGIRARDVSGTEGEVSVTETITGRVVSLIARYGAEPAERRRLVYGIGGGIGAYKIDVENYFENVTGERPGVERSKLMVYQPWGVQVNVDARYYVAPRRALRAYVAVHAAGSVRTEPVGSRDFLLQSHNVSMSWATAGVGLAIHF